MKAKRNKLTMIYLCFVAALFVWPVLVNSDGVCLLGDEPYETWYEMEIENTDGAGGYYNGIVSYYPEGIVVPDKIITQPDPLIQDLVLRVVPELTTFGQGSKSGGKSTPWATVISVNGEYSYDDLKKLNVDSLEVFHGKVYVGVMALDNYVNSDGTLGTDDTFRRLLYVTESVQQGSGVSRAFRPGKLAGTQLYIKGIRPCTPHLEGQLFTCPTSISLQIRSAATSGALKKASFVGKYELPASGEASFNLVFPTGHKWFQYKVVMSTGDSRLTPVLEQVKVTTTSGTVIDDTDWSGGQLTENTNLFDRHSPGELVLANAKQLDGQVKMIKVIQAPCVEVPQWFFEFTDPSRNFSLAHWPYPSVADLEPFEGKLYMRVGTSTFTAPAGCQGGDFASYDYAGGLVKVEAQFYHSDDPHDPNDYRFHGEGGGWLRKMGDLLINAQPDSKIQGFSAEYYMYTDGDGSWDVGYIGNPIAGALNHAWDMIEIGGHYFVSTNPGVLYRPVPQTAAEHLDADAWNYFGLSGDIMAQAAFNIFGSHLLMDYSLYMSDYTSDVGLLSIDEGINTVLQVQYTEGTVNGARGSTQFEGHLVYWSHMNSDFFRFSDPEFRAIPPSESLKWRKGIYDSHELPIEGDENSLLWTIVDGALPQGLSLHGSQGIVDGRPQEAGAFDVVFQVVEVGAPPLLQSTVRYSIVVSERLMSQKR